ncbi:MAG: DUF1302 family protein, partial [Oceanisphaera sp.]|nr:DUF1302 family protein [Oceanisphaera sp.]
DFAGDGGQKVMLGFGDVPDMGDLSAEQTFLAVPRGADRKPGDDGQYGVALRVFVPAINNTEVGFYYMNYHSRVPVVSAQTGTVEGATAAGTIAAVTPDIITQVVVDGGNPTSAIGAYSPVIGQPAATAIAGSSALGYAQGGVPGAMAGGAQAGQAFATDALAKSSRYIIEYPEDIKLYGMSFNTQLESIGASLSGEYSYRNDVPLQMDDIELLLAALSPLGGAALDNQIGVYGLNTYIPGYIEKDVSQVQMTMAKTFGPTLGADQFVIVGEAGMTYVHNMPGKSELRLDGPGTYVTGNPRQSQPGGAHAGKPAEGYDVFADQDSWGYRVVTKMDFNDAIGAVTLSPRIAWSHDVDGNSPGP